MVAFYSRCLALAQRVQQQFPLWISKVRMTQPLMGGYLQRLAQAHEQEQLEEEEPADEPKPSKLANLLPEKWSWGPCQPQNCSLWLKQRLLMALLIPKRKAWPESVAGENTGQRKLPLHGCLSNYRVSLKPKQNVTEDVGLDFLLPHMLFSSLFNDLPDAFPLFSAWWGCCQCWQVLDHHEEPSHSFCQTRTAESPWLAQGCASCLAWRRCQMHAVWHGWGQSHGCIVLAQPSQQRPHKNQQLFGLPHCQDSCAG